MKLNRYIIPVRVMKWKSILYVHGGHKEHVLNCINKYAYVASRYTIQTLLTLSLLNKCYTRQIHFVLAYLQVPIHYDLFTMLPKVLITKLVNHSTHCLQLLNKVYDKKQSVIVLNQYLVQGLMNINFDQSDIDRYVFYRGEVICFYVNDVCFLSPCSKYMERAIADLKDAKKKCKFDLEDHADISDYLGINFTKLMMVTSNLTRNSLLIRSYQKLKRVS